MREKTWVRLILMQLIWNILRGEHLNEMIKMAFINSKFPIFMFAWSWTHWLQVIFCKKLRQKRQKNVKIVSPDCNRAGQLNPDYNGWLGVPGPLSCSLSIHCGYHQTSIFELTPTSDSRHNRVFKYDNSIVNCTLCRPNCAPLISPSQDGEMFSQMLSFQQTSST